MLRSRRYNILYPNTSRKTANQAHKLFSRGLYTNKENNRVDLSLCNISLPFVVATIDPTIGRAEAFNVTFATDRLIVLESCP